MKNLAMVAVLFGGLLLFSESEYGEATIFGGVDVMVEVVEVEALDPCIATTTFDENCDNATDEQDCGRTFKALGTSKTETKDWKWGETHTADVCRNLDGKEENKNEYCDAEGSWGVDNNCEHQAPAGGGGGPIPGTEVVIFD